jgi:hypothetical protein
MLRYAGAISEDGVSNRLTMARKGLDKVFYLRWTSGSALDLLHQIALELDLVPAHYRGDHQPAMPR